MSALQAALDRRHEPGGPKVTVDVVRLELVCAITLLLTRTNVYPAPNVEKIILLTTIAELLTDALLHWCECEAQHGALMGKGPARARWSEEDTAKLIKRLQSYWAEVKP